VTLVRPLCAAAAGAVTCAVVAHMTTGSDFLQLVAAGSVGLLTYVVIVVPSEQRRRWSGRAFALIPLVPARAEELR
jgi:bacteriorhodopsin